MERVCSLIRRASLKISSKCHPDPLDDEHEEERRGIQQSAKRLLLVDTVKHPLFCIESVSFQVDVQNVWFLIGCLSLHDARTSEEPIFIRRWT